MSDLSPRVEYWLGKRRGGRGLFAAACADAAQVPDLLSLAPDLLVYHPAFTERTPEGETGMLSALGFMGGANGAADRGFPSLPGLCFPCPVAMGVLGSDPFLLGRTSIAGWKEKGMEGLANFPTVTLADGLFRADLEAEGFGFGREVEYLQLARAEGLFTVGLAGHPEEAAALADAECDLLILHLGLTMAAEPRSLTAHPGLPGAYLAAIRNRRRADPLVLLHSDCLATPEDEAAWRPLFHSATGWDGLFAAGGIARIKALQALIPQA